MRPLLLKGHERSITYVTFNREGDLLFTMSKDNHPTVWFSENGERLGTYEGHQGTVYHCDVSPDSKLLLTASADQDVKLWEVETGREIHTWHLPGAARCVKFSESGDRFLTCNDKFSTKPARICVFPFTRDFDALEDEPLQEAQFKSSPFLRLSQAAWLALDRGIVAALGGDIMVMDPTTLEVLRTFTEHTEQINAFCFDKRSMMMLTCSADRDAKLWDLSKIMDEDAEEAPIRKTYPCDRPLNCGAISPLKEHIIMGGGQEASEVTTTASAVGKFEVRFYHLIFGNELGRVKGHFGPVNTCAFSPCGRIFASGAEDGYVRLHHFDSSYFILGDDLEMSKAELDKFASDNAEDMESKTTESTGSAAASAGSRATR